MKNVHILYVAVAVRKQEESERGCGGAGTDRVI